VAPERSSESAVHTARRAQLVDAAIDVLARDGYAAASTVRIARAAGVSRGVLTYHFRDRADLIAEVVRTVYTLAGAEPGPRVVRAGSSRASLLAFVGGSVAFYAAHPRHLAALSAVFSAQERDGTNWSARSTRRPERKRDDRPEPDRGRLPCYRPWCWWPRARARHPKSRR
jgi:AcrR family transcriptional regulator